MQMDVEFTQELFTSAEQAVQQLMLYKAHVDSSDAALKLGVSDANVSDLVPGTYEGGFKLWEGARDLTQIVCAQWHWGEAGAQRQQDMPGIQVLPERLQGRRVLELGCGHGLPGIACLLAGAQVLLHVRPGAFLPVFRTLERGFWCSGSVTPFHVFGCEKHM